MVTQSFTPSAEATEAVVTEPKRRSGGKVSAGKYDIDVSHPLSNFENEFAEAYECSNNEAGVNDHLAIVIKGRYPARKDALDKCLSNDIPGLMTLRTMQTVEWGDGSVRYALIFKRPDGHPILGVNTPKREPLSEETVRRGIIRPIFQTLHKMSNIGLFHGNIRPSNIFLTNHENAQATLGECASSIPGIIQPLIYETIERSMTDRQARGVGTEYDDIYSFGATIAILLRGFNHLEGKSDKFIIEEKIARGSYSLLTDGLRLSPGLSEFLRATLNDDQKQRWDIDQLAAWVDGNRTTPKQSSGGTKAQRHLEFNNKKYMRPRMLAKDLSESPTEAVTLIESGNLTKWVERALGDQTMASTLNAAIGRASTTGRTQGFEDRLLCYVSMALDPFAPIRFKELRVMPLGIGHSLAMAMINGDNLQVYGELIRERYGWAWFNQQLVQGENYVSLTHLFDHASKMIVRRGIDYGLERCLYELCADVPCLSEFFENHYVVDCQELLKALDDVAKNHTDERPLDRHIASFISIRDNRDNAGLMSLLEGNDLTKRSLALITIYQLLQRRFNLTKLQNLAQWLVREAEVVALRFKNVEVRNDAVKQIVKAANTGSLTKLLTAIDNPVQVKKDEYEFLKAVRQYNAYNRERNMITSELANNPQYGFKTGHYVALVISLIISGIIVAATLLTHFAGMEQ